MLQDRVGEEEEEEEEGLLKAGKTAVRSQSGRERLVCYMLQARVGEVKTAVWSQSARGACDHHRV